MGRLPLGLLGTLVVLACVWVDAQDELSETLDRLFPKGSRTFTKSSNPSMRLPIPKVAVKHMTDRDLLAQSTGITGEIVIPPEPGPAAAKARRQLQHREPAPGVEWRDSLDHPHDQDTLEFNIQGSKPLDQKYAAEPQKTDSWNTGVEKVAGAEKEKEEEKKEVAKEAKKEEKVAEKSIMGVTGGPGVEVVQAPTSSRVQRAEEEAISEKSALSPKGNETSPQSPPKDKEIMNVNNGPLRGSCTMIHPASGILLWKFGNQVYPDGKSRVSESVQIQYEELPGMGDEVVAPDEGTVLDLKTACKGGRLADCHANERGVYVLIHHPRLMLTSLMGPLDKVKAERGKKVKRGERIGTLAKFGRLFKQLRIEFRSLAHANKLVDPCEYMSCPTLRGFILQAGGCEVKEIARDYTKHKFCRPSPDDAKSDKDRFVARMLVKALGALRRQGSNNESSWPVQTRKTQKGKPNQRSSEAASGLRFLQQQDKGFFHRQDLKRLQRKQEHLHNEQNQKEMMKRRLRNGRKRRRRGNRKKGAKGTTSKPKQTKSKERRKRGRKHKRRRRKNKNKAKPKPTTPPTPNTVPTVASIAVCKKNEIPCVDGRKYERLFRRLGPDAIARVVNAVVPDQATLHKVPLCGTLLRVDEAPLLPHKHMWPVRT